MQFHREASPQNFPAIPSVTRLRVSGSLSSTIVQIGSATESQPQRREDKLGYSLEGLEGC